MGFIPRCPCCVGVAEEIGVDALVDMGFVGRVPDELDDARGREGLVVPRPSSAVRDEDAVGGRVSWPTPFCVPLKVAVQPRDRDAVLLAALTPDVKEGDMSESWRIPSRRTAG